MDYFYHHEETIEEKRESVARHDRDIAAKKKLKEEKPDYFDGKRLKFLSREWPVEYVSHGGWGFDVFLAHGKLRLPIGEIDCFNNDYDRPFYDSLTEYENMIRLLEEYQSSEREFLSKRMFRPEDVNVFDSVNALKYFMDNLDV